MCSVCGVIILDHENLPDLEALIGNAREQLRLERIGIPVEIDGRALAENGMMAAGYVYILNNLLQGRGEHSSGIVTQDGQRMYVHRGMGTCVDAIRQEHLMELPGDLAIGHNRYSTTGRNERRNAQPFVSKRLKLALGHNGNIANEEEVRESIVSPDGWPFRLASATDSELMLYAIAAQWDKKRSLADNTIGTLEHIFVGAYSLTMIAGSRLIGIRDPRGFWPLKVGKIGGMYLMASEEQAIQDIAGFSGYGRPDFIRDVENGGMVCIGFDQMLSSHQARRLEKRMCSLNDIYLTTSHEPGIPELRFEHGRILGNEFRKGGLDADYVTGVPNSGIIPALGFAKSSGLGYNNLAIRINPKYEYRRQFISLEDGQEVFRHSDPEREKFLYSRADIEGKRIVVVEDSIIKANTMDSIVRRMREHGAEELHIRTIFPRYDTGCKNGIQASAKDLIARRLGMDRDKVELYFMARFFGVDYSRRHLVQQINNDDFDISELVERSITVGKNFLGRERVGKIDKSRFSLRYMTIGQSDEAYRNVGRNPNELCRACNEKPAVGYPLEIEPFVRGRV